MKTAATLYLHAGLCILTADLKSKKPAMGRWKKYQDRLPTDIELNAWLTNHPSALCIVTGTVSGNLELMDFDDHGRAYEPWRAAVEAQEPGLADHLVVERSQSGGIHVIYRCEAPVDGNRKLAMMVTTEGEMKALIETRGQGGYFLCSPTPGYELQQGDFHHIQTITEDEREILLRAAIGLSEFSPPPVEPARTKSTGKLPASLRPGDDFNERGDVAALLHQHGWTCTRSGENSYWRRPHKDHGHSATLKDRVFYVFSSSAAPFEPNTAYSPFAVFTWLTCGPEKWKGAAEQLRRQGYGEPASRPQDQVDISGIVGEKVEPTPAQRPGFMTARELVLSYPQLREPIIDRLFRRGEMMNLIAAPKIGKSWLALDMAVAVGTGRPWLSTFQTQQGRVLILDNELHRETLANRLPRVAAARNLRLDDYGDTVLVDTARGRNLDVHALRNYFLRFQPGYLQLVILDAFYRFLPIGVDENSNADLTGLFNEIDVLADRLGCAFCLIHHTSKGSQSLKAITDVGSGAGAQARATDCHAVLRPHEEDKAVVFDAAVRSFPPVEPLVLRWDFPVWQPAPDLDPVRLAEGRRKKKAEPAKPSKPMWTTEDFIEAFATASPKTRAQIMANALAGGVSQRTAEMLLTAAIDGGLLFRWTTDDERKPAYASVKQS